MRFKSRHLNPTGTDNMVFIIGESPPKRQRKKDVNWEVFHGTRTGDFIEELVKDHWNVFLTNICLHQNKTELNVQIGINQLEREFHELPPRAIVLLGGFAKKHFDLHFKNKYWILRETQIHYLPHPSWVLRFNKDNSKSKFTKQFKKIIHENLKTTKG